MIDGCGGLNAISRRGFVQRAVCAAAGITLAGPSGASAFGQGPRGGREVMREFPYGAVRLTGGPIKQHFDRIHAHYLALDNDRLLKVFRERAGLPAPGPDMGGWYDTDGFVPGLTLGQYISGLARLGAATGDRAAHDKVARLVFGFVEFNPARRKSICRAKCAGAVGCLCHGQVRRRACRRLSTQRR